MRILLLALALIFATGCSILQTMECMDNYTDTCVGCTDDCLEPDKTLEETVGYTTA